MLVVPRSDIVLAGMITLRQNGINVIHRVAFNSRLNQVRLKFDLARIRQLDVPDRSKDTVLVNRVNVAHGDNPPEVCPILTPHIVQIETQFYHIHAGFAQ